MCEEESQPGEEDDIEERDPQIEISPEKVKSLKEILDENPDHLVEVEFKQPKPYFDVPQFALGRQGCPPQRLWGVNLGGNKEGDYSFVIKEDGGAEEFYVLTIPLGCISEVRFLIYADEDCEGKKQRIGFK